MTIISSLPTELLSNIFNKLDNNAHLAQCRLVCKAWSDPAERAMLGNTVTISWMKSRSLHAFLKKNPEKAYLIKRLKLDHCDYQAADPIMMESLKLALTPNIESLTCITFNDDLIKALADIVEKHKLQKLTTLALRYRESKYSHRLLLPFQNTLQAFKLDIGHGSIDWNLMDKLDQFIHLTSLDLTAAFGNITNLDRILSKCSQLKNLTLTALAWERLVIDWKRKKVQQNSNLKKLSLSVERSPLEMLDYIVYKYPSIESATVSVSIDDSRFGEGYITQIPRLLHGVPQRELLCNVTRDASFEFVLKCLKKMGCEITIESAVVWGNNYHIKIFY